ncbi:hypothetical protein Pcaca05_23860 [Pectobacterium carotovorum subsp. carotovorum]|nr:hypothetical protein Pcaca05_23860 [Pectobacterium carotovorum subsp. carotovorum]
MGCEKDATNFIMTSAPTNLSYYLKLYDNIRMPEFNGNNQTNRHFYIAKQQIGVDL